MERFDRNVGAIDAALQKAPEILQSVGVNIPVDILDGVIDDLVRVSAAKPS